MSNLAYKIDDGFDGEMPDLLRAAENGDIKEAIAALNRNPDCINDTTDINANALQVAILSFQEEFAHFMIDSTNISLLHKDVFGRTALDMALFISSDEFCEKVFDLWQKEYFSHVNDEGYFVDPNPPSA